MFLHPRELRMIEMERGEWIELGARMESKDTLLMGHNLGFCFV